MEQVEITRTAQNELLLSNFSDSVFFVLIDSETGVAKVLEQSWLRPSDVIWRQGSRSTLAQVMAWCPTAPSHYLNQCWQMTSEVLWHSPDNNFIENTYNNIYRWNEFEIYQFETVVKFPRDQWVNSCFTTCSHITWYYTYHNNGKKRLARCWLHNI